MTKDGHGIKTYLLFSLSNFPKIIHRLVPFIFFIALFFTLINYELKNELLIFWINGVSKIKFINHIIYISIVLMIIQLSLGSFFSPYFQFKGRMFLKESKIDFFTSLISEGKFLSVMDGLTIFIESQNYDGSFNNIFIDDSSKVNKKMIYAKYGILVEDFNIKKFKLYNGEISNMERNKINNFEFEQIDFNLTNFNSSTILVPKIQELSSKNLLKCLINLEFKKKLILSNKNINCEKNIYNEIRQELFKRFYKPLYIPLIALASCYLLLTSKMKFSYNKLRNIVYRLKSFLKKYMLIKSINKKT